MAKNLKLLIVAGARPNFMKVAPLIWRIKAMNAGAPAGAEAVDYRLVHTGQHYDDKMSSVFFAELGIPAPHINLAVGSGSHAVQTAAVMTKFEPVCLAERPDFVVVVGDVNSTLACTLVCAKLGIRVAHVEAGLRSFDRGMPEEVNRVVTDALADLLLTPSRDGNENLLREGVPLAKIRLVGNVMIDALMANLSSARAIDLEREYGVRRGEFAYVTLHRPSNVDQVESLAAIMSELRRLAERLPVTFPMHPRTRKMCEQFNLSLNGVAQLRIIDPIGYHQSLCLAENARMVLTDSGGLQEESTYFRTPCLTLRPNTERPVTVTMGSNRLTALPQLRADIEAVLAGPERLGQVPELWDGHAAHRILDEIATSSGLQEPCQTTRES